MNELLDLSKVEVQAAHWFIDEQAQHHVSIDKEVSEQKFGQFMEIHSFIGQVQTEIKWKCLFIGWALKEMLDERLYNYVKRKDSYSLHGYTSFYKFVSEIYGIKERTAKRMVAVAREFCLASDPTSVREDQLKDLPVCQLKLEYINYSYSQLAELLAIEEQYRPRLPVSASVRDMQKIGKLYASGYVPKRSDTYKDDLEVYKERKKEEQDKKNAKQKQINFVPAQPKVPTSALFEKGSVVKLFEDYDDEDERDVITPAEERQIPFSSIKAGLEAQLFLLKKHYPEWEPFIVNVSWALFKDDPKLLKTVEDSTLSGVQPPTGKLSLKNQKERKDWLENYKAWGVWLDVPQVSKKYYRYDFINGASLIVEENREYYNYGKSTIKTFVRYGIIDKDCPEFADGKVGGASGVVEWMTKHAKEI